MKTPRIAKAMEYIDDDLVSGAVTYTRTKKKNNWVKWGAIAACFALVLCICIPLSFHVDPNDVGVNDDHPFGYLNVGENKNYKHGFVTYDDKKDNSIIFTFTVNNANDTEYQLSKNYYIEYEENGNIKKSYQNSYGTSDYFDIWVNGEKIQIVQMGEYLEYDFSFLKTPGTYQITVDYSNLFEDKGRGVLLNMNFWGIVEFDVSDYEKSN